jgi:hypothetical protein
MLRSAVVLFLALSLAACAKKTGVAIVVEKEHIDVREPTVSPPPEKERAVREGPTYREMAPDEIDVNGIVMKKEVRGTSKDPRASNEEQWRVTVELTEVSRRFFVPADRAHYDKLKKGDRVKVKYSEGKYTGTVWGAEFVD